MSNNCGAVMCYRKVEELQRDLSSSTQKIAKLNDDLDRLQQEREREVGEIVNKHKEEVSLLQGQLDDMVRFGLNF